MSNTVTIHTDNAEETRRIGQIIGESASPGDVYLLTGPLGAGKTCLTQGIARGLQVDGYARSPTFVLMTRYQGRLTLHHADLYRIDHPAEAWDLGFDDIVAAGQDVLIVEWADRADELFPDDALWIDLDYALDEVTAPCEVIPDEDGGVPARHTITIEGAPERFAGLLQELEAIAL
ncbi:MAG: tRNA (adenosine(37)-N6)-threonylcarbamoyltransferase complex ATPase subunit type 1 TsaE [Chloroflexi bacterium]|nr:tRNA (adenosine(37)-N6)-threonylcarbamoyltransferase complex ATPase subunit type 1 TsaE [Chloroflexota bacterium]